MARWFDGIRKKEVFSWALFDFANSSYALLIISFVFPIYFKEVIAGPQLGDFYWGLITSISVLIGGVAAPIIGAIADVSRHRKHKFVFFTLLAIIGTASLFFTGPGTLLFAAIVFVVANASFEIAVVLYDAYLPQVSTQKTLSKVSGLGWGLGYIGGIVAMLVLQPLYGAGYLGNEFLYRLTFPLTALFFFVFAIPCFIYVKDAPGKIAHFGTAIKNGFTQLRATFRDVRKYRNIGVFLAAFYFLHDALVTVFAFVPIYASTTFDMSVAQIAMLVLLAQLVAAPSTVILGALADRFGKKKLQLITVVGWIGVLLLMIFTSTVTMFFIAAALAGVVMGSSQAIARSWLAELIPKGKEAQFFGFNGFASKVAATMGPVLFGAVSVLTGNQRIAMATLIPFFAISFVLFLYVPEKR